MKKSVLLLLFISITLITACSAQTIIKFDPLEENEYYMGRQIAAKEDEDVKVSVEFDSYSNDEISFYVQVENKSGNRMLFDPKNVYVKFVEEDGYDDDMDRHRFYALNPDIEIDRINSEMEERNNLHSAVTGLNTVFAAISIIGDLADHHRHKAHRVAKDISLWAHNQANEEINYNASMDNLDAKKDFWKNEVFRKTDLYRNENIGGLIFIPLRDEPEQLKIVIPFNGNNYSFQFGKVEMN